MLLQPDQSILRVNKKNMQVFGIDIATMDPTNATFGKLTVNK